LDKLTAYAAAGYARFHMPGHKGVLPPPFSALAPLDVTELAQTGDLYREGASGAIRRSEARMARLFGAADCLYLTGGATQGIFAMLAAAARPGETVLVDRASHQSVYNALALLDLRPVYLPRALLPPWNIPCFWDALPAPASGESASPPPVIYTCPSYYGVLAPRPAARGRVLCDAAHGAHLPFVLDAAPPGATWVVSAHKTLGAMGQTACLLTDGAIPAAALREKAAVFGTASPSFALLASLDGLQHALQPENRPDFRRVADFVRELAASDGRILTAGGLREGCALDPMRIVLYTGAGFEDAARLVEDYGVVPEMADRYNLVFLLSPHNTDDDLRRLRRAVASVPQRPPAPPAPPAPLPAISATPREAFFAPREQVALAKAAGRIAAQAVAPFPPGIPIFAPGEKIDEIHLEILSELCYNKLDSVWVIK